MSLDQLEEKMSILNKLFDELGDLPEDTPENRKIMMRIYVTMGKKLLKANANRL